MIEGKIEQNTGQHGYKPDEDKGLPLFWEYQQVKKTP
jgi:hypothetical protein